MTTWLVDDPIFLFCFKVDTEAPICVGGTCISNEDYKIWKGKAFIPNEYFPPNVDKFNAYAIHGPENQRVFKSLFPFDPNLSMDFHRLEFFQPLNFEVEQKVISDFWQNALNKN